MIHKGEATKRPEMCKKNSIGPQSLVNRPKHPPPKMPPTLTPRWTTAPTPPRTGDESGLPGRSV